VGPEEESEAGWVGGLVKSERFGGKRAINTGSRGKEINLGWGYWVVGKPEEEGKGNFLLGKIVWLNLFGQ